MIPAAQAVIHSAQGGLAAAAGEIDRRSSGSKDSSLAQQLGERSARGLVASRGGMSLPATVDFWQRPIRGGDLAHPKAA